LTPEATRHKNIEMDKGARALHPNNVIPEDDKFF
jgi:hypothetical protein